MTKKKLTKIEELEAQLKVMKALDKQNKAFDKLSKMDKRVAIAKDVIANLNSKKFIAKHGSYIETIGDNKQINQFTLLDTTCNVCAIGSLLTGRISRGNKLDINLDTLLHIDDFAGEEEIKLLKDLFTAKELRYIEYAFEGWNINDSFEFTDKEIEKVEKFFDSYINRNANDYEIEKSRSDDKRLRAIMNNIIKNKGKFVL